MQTETLVDTVRHATVFSQSEFDNTRVDVIGCGATGSRIAMSLAKLGILNLHLWDFDVVEGHNIANQIFGLPDIGRPKVEALGARILADTGLQATLHAEKVDGSQPLGSVVFLLTDTMASRKEIWEGAIRYRQNVKVMIETRMGVTECRVYCVRPNVVESCAGWEKTLYSDEQAVESACGTKISVGPTAELISGQSVWSFIRWWQSQRKDSEVKLPPSEYIFGALVPVVLQSHFER